MSFLSGILNFGKKALGNNLVQIALLGYAVNKLSKNAIKDNNPSGSENIDGGVRLQIPPSSNNKIPVLYGEAFFGGTITDAELSANSQTMYYCLTLAEKTGTLLSTGSASAYTFKDVYWNDARIVFRTDGITADYTVDRSGNIDRSISGLVKVYCYSGSSVDGQVPENYTNNSVPNAYSVMPSWNLNHLMNDLIFAVVEVTYSREKNITGLGDMLFQISNTMKYPGDCLYDYFQNEMFGAGIPLAEIDTTSLSNLNTYSQQSVSYEDEGTGAQTLDDRYQINGVIDTNNNVIENIENICSAAGSWLSYNVYDGKWSVVINKAGSSVASFNDTNIIDNVIIQGTGLQDLYNSVKVEFPHRDLRDSADFVTIEIPDGDRNANEYDNTLNISYEIINEPIQAQLLGFIELKQSRVDLIVRFQTDYSYLNLNAGDIIDITNSAAGWTNKLFRIVSINEKQDADGPIILNFTALEYDANVYSTNDLFRYTRTDENGIVTIGSIGIPGTPQVTKFEVASRPRVIIETTSPTGVVSGIEYWLTTDIAEANDADRSYTLIGTKVPTGGGVFSSGTTVILDYDNLGATDFYIKTRGFNATTVGPFSDPSGLIEFVPTQTTDAISSDTGLFDNTTGQLLTALAVLDLLKGVDELYQGISGNSSLFGKIFEVFEDVTGYNLLGNAQDGTLQIDSNVDENLQASASQYYTSEVVCGSGGISLGKIEVPQVNPVDNSRDWLVDCTQTVLHYSDREMQAFPKYFISDNSGTEYLLVFNLTDAADNTRIESTAFDANEPNGERLGTGYGYYISWDDSQFIDSNLELPTEVYSKSATYSTVTGSTKYEPGRKSLTLSGITTYWYSPLAFRGSYNAINNILQGKGLTIDRTLSVVSNEAGKITMTIYKDNVFYDELTINLNKRSVSDRPYEYDYTPADDPRP